MSGNEQESARAQVDADPRLEQLNEEIRRLESEAATWGSPVKRMRLEAIRRARAAIARTRLRLDWSRLGTDGAGMI